MGTRHGAQPVPGAYTTSGRWRTGPSAKTCHCARSAADDCRGRQLAPLIASPLPAKETKMSKQKPRDHQHAHDKPAHDKPAQDKLALERLRTHQTRLVPKT